MAPSSKPTNCNEKPSLIPSYVVSSCCAVGFIALVLITSAVLEMAAAETTLTGRRKCDEIYVVGEGETLQTISEKCGDLYIVERNPHIQDPDDVFPGLVIKIVPSSSLFEP